MRRHGLMLAGAAVSSILLLAACSGSSSTQESTSGSETDAPSSETTEAEAPSAEGSGLVAALVQAVVNPFYDAWPAVIGDATQNLNIQAEIASPQDFDQVQQNQVIDSLVAKGINGIAVQTVDGTSGSETIRRLVEQQIPVVGVVACADQEGSGSSLCLNVGLEDSIYQATMLLCEALGGEGNIVHLDGNLADKNTAARISGVDRALGECPGLKLLQRVTDIDSAELAQNAVSSLLASDGDQVDAIVSGAYNPSVAVASEFTNRQESRIKAVLVDTDPVVLEAVKAGYVLATRAANVYEVGYLALYSLDLLRSGCSYSGSNFVIDIPYNTVDQGNVANFQSEAVTKALKTAETWKTDYFTCS